MHKLSELENNKLQKIGYTIDISEINDFIHVQIKYNDDINNIVIKEGIIKQTDIEQFYCIINKIYFNTKHFIDSYVILKISSILEIKKNQNH